MHWCRSSLILNIKVVLWLTPIVLTYSPFILLPHRGKHKRASMHEVSSTQSKTIDHSVEIIAGYCLQILDRICSSAEQCPRILRVALRQLWQRVEERFTGPEYKVGLNGQGGAWYAVQFCDCRFTPCRDIYWHYGRNLSNVNAKCQTVLVGTYVHWHACRSRCLWVLTRSTCWQSLSFSLSVPFHIWIYMCLTPQNVPECTCLAELC